MSREPTGFPRREFLGKYIAAPVVVTLLGNHTGSATALNQERVEALLKHADPEAVYRRVALADEHNAWPTLLKAKELIAPLDKLFEDDSEPTLWDEASILRPLPVDRDQQLRQVLNDYRESLQIIDEAIDKAGLQYPQPDGWRTFDRDTEDIGLLRQCSMLKTLRAKVAFHEQRYADAARDLCDLLRLGQMLALGDGFALHYLVAVAIRADAQRNLRRLIAHRQTPVEVVKPVLASLEKFVKQDDGAAQTLRVELCCFCLPIVTRIEETKDSAKLARSLVSEYVCHDMPEEDSQAAKNCRSYEECIAKLLAGHAASFNRKETVVLASQITSEDIRQLEVPFNKRRRMLFEATQKSIAGWPKALQLDDFPFWTTDLGRYTEKLVAPSDADLKTAQNALRDVRNPLGKILAVSGADTQVSRVSAIAAARLCATQLSTAVTLFERTHGQLPPALDSLVEAKLLGEVPRDPFDGKAFRYSSERKVVWSVGQEGKNQGIVPPQEDPMNPFDEDSELTWRL